MPGHLFEGNPVDEGTTGRSTDAPVHLRIPGPERSREGIKAPHTPLSQAQQCSKHRIYAGSKLCLPASVLLPLNLQPLLKAWNDGEGSRETTRGKRIRW